MVEISRNIQLISFILFLLVSDALGVLVRTLGKTHMQLSEDCLKLGMNLIETEITDPDIRRTA